jgi:hypothetical protein
MAVTRRAADLAAPEPHTPERWRSRRGAAALLRVCVFLLPLGAGYLAGRIVSASLPEPDSVAETLGWWVLVLASATLAGHFADRLGRRLLPLTVLLRMTMLFPDQAPSRMRIAQQAGNVTELKRRIHEALDEGNNDMAATSELILSLAGALSAHDRKTRGHSERTRSYADLLAEQMRIPDEDRDRLRWAALLHDVGKLEIPGEILNKNGPLSEEEWDLVSKHPIHGMRLIAPLAEWLGPWAQTIEHHHERWDGSGYPYGLVGTDIALGARIVSVADAYDVITTGRSYQSKVDHASARAEIAKHSGTQFDPTVVRALMNLNMTKMRWATGPLAALAQFPLLRPLQSLGRDVSTLLSAAAVVGAAGLAGVAAAPILPPLPVVAAEAPVSTTTTQAVAGAPTSVPDSTSTTGKSTTTTEAPTSTTTTFLEPTVTQQGVPPSSSTSTTTTQPTTTSTTQPTTTSTTQPSTTTTTQPPNQPPVAVNDTAGTTTGNAVTVSVLANDSDPEGGTLTVTSVGNPQHGTTTTNGTTARYTPASGYSGPDSFGYTVCDPLNACSTTTVAVTVAPNGQPPVAVTDTASVDPGDSVRIRVLRNDSDPDGDLNRNSLTITVAPPPGQGTAVVSNSWAYCGGGRRGNRPCVRYTAPNLFTGTVVFSYQICDFGGNCSTTTVTVTVS